MGWNSWRRRRAAQANPYYNRMGGGRGAACMGCEAWRGFDTMGQKMRIGTREFCVVTHGQGLYEFTAPVQQWVSQSGVETGLLTLFCRHTSASLVVQENADPDVVGDLERFFTRIVPEQERLYRHADEGPDDMPAHIRAALTQTSVSIPVVAGRPALGAWQGIYLFEHRRAPHRRGVAAVLLGELE